MGALILFLALVLAASAAHKAHSPARLAPAAARLAGVAAPLGPVLLVLAGTLEAVAALCLPFGATRPAGLLIAGLVWGGYALALTRRRGEVLDCGCDLVARPRAVGAPQVLRPVALAALALGLLVLPPVPDADGTLLPMQLPIQLLAALGLFALAIAHAEILAIPRPAWRKS